MEKVRRVFAANPFVVRVDRARESASEEHVERLKKAFLAEGQGTEVEVVRRDGEFHVVDGAYRVWAARDLGWRFVWCGEWVESKVRGAATPARGGR